MIMLCLILKYISSHQKESFLTYFDCLYTSDQINRHSESSITWLPHQQKLILQIWHTNIKIQTAIFFSVIHKGGRIKYTEKISIVWYLNRHQIFKIIWYDFVGDNSHWQIYDIFKLEIVDQWSIKIPPPPSTHLLMLIIICAKYGTNSSRTVSAVEPTRQYVSYFSSFIAKSWLNDLEDISQNQRSLHMTHPLTQLNNCTCKTVGCNYISMSNFNSNH